MKRQLKFRAWDDHALHMAYSDNTSDDYVWAIETEVICGFLTEPHSHSVDEPPEPDFITLDNIMQFTGLKDKNGREIYEDDIVIVGAYGRKNVVKFVGANVRTHHGQGDCSEEIFCGWEIGYAWGVNNEVEVIGNVFENPELLNEKSPT